MAGNEETRLAKIAAGFIMSGAYTLTGQEAGALLREAAAKLGIDLRKADMERTREILSKGTPLSHLVREMRET